MAVRSRVGCKAHVVRDMKCDPCRRWALRLREPWRMPWSSFLTHCGVSLNRRFWLWVEEDGDCWVWTGDVTAGGYGTWDHDVVHRVAYREMVAEIPAGYEVDHLCRNTRCVKPDHLEAVPPRVNKNRIVNKGRPKGVRSGN